MKLLEKRLKQNKLFNDWIKTSNQINSKSKLTFKCPIHGNIYEVRIDHVFGKHKRGCPICGNNCWSKYKFETQIIPKLTKMNISVISEVNNNMNVKTNIKLHCNVCGKNWEAKIVWLKNSKFCCSGCNASTMEYELQHILKSQNIKYIAQKTYKNLIGVNGGKLSYDFFIPSLNILIECQGSQHFYKFGFDIDGSKFQKQQEHDKRKRLFAKQNHIKLIEIKFNENIQNVMEDIIRCNDQP